jgi:hypothetical protein
MCRRIIGQISKSKTENKERQRYPQHRALLQKNYTAAEGQWQWILAAPVKGLSTKEGYLEVRGSWTCGKKKRRILTTPTPELELELIQTQMAQKPMLRAEVGMRVRCANKASAE